MEAMAGQFKWVHVPILPHQKSAQTSVEDSERVFKELIHSAQWSCSELTKLIRAQEEAELRRARGLLEKLKKEISEMQEKATEMSEISDTDDHVRFIQVPMLRCP